MCGILGSDRGGAALCNLKAIHHRLKRGLSTVNEAFQLGAAYRLLAWQRGVAEA